MKKILALLLAVVMVMSLAACGAADTGKLDEIQAALAGIQASLDKLTEGAAPAPAPGGDAPAAPEAPAASKTDTLKIGLLINQTGWFAGVDTTNYNEFNAMIDYINENGGWIVGDTAYQLEGICVDGQSDNATLRTAALSLVDAGVDFVVETNDFWVTTCADVFEEEGIFHASAYCVGNNVGYIVPDNPLAFTGSDGSIGDLQACFAALAAYYPDVKTVAFANDDNGSTDDTYALLETMATANGFEMVGQVIYPGDTTDYSSYAQSLVDTGADAIIGNGSPDAYGAVLKAVRALGDDMVMACAQGKPVSMVMEYAGPDASYNGFTVGASTRESDKSENPDLLNAVADRVKEMYGTDTFDGAAANTLYTILQMMQRAGSVDPADVAAAWEAGGPVDSLYGPAVIGGTETYGVANHAVGHPRPVSIMDPEAEDGWYFAGWLEVEIP